MLFFGRETRARQVTPRLFHLAICFQFWLFWFLKSKDCCQKKDKSRQAERGAVNQTSSFPAHDEVLCESVRHMVDKFSRTVPGWSGSAGFCMRSLFYFGRGVNRTRLQNPICYANSYIFQHLHNCLICSFSFVLQHADWGSLICSSLPVVL